MSVPRLIDSTLREGDQSPGVYLRPAEKAEIAVRLAQAGIEEIEVGPAVPRGGPGEEELPDLVERIRHRLGRPLGGDASPPTRLAVWCRGLPADLEAACSVRPDVVSLCLPVSDLHLSARLRRTPGWLVQQVGALAGRARELGVPYLSLGLEDATRADPRLVEAVLDAASDAGVDRVRLADTVGVATPSEVVSLVRRCAGRFGGELAVHTHDDFGMATANALAALDAGAAWADVSVLGTGERAGIARTEEVAGFLALRRGAPYRLAQLRALCHLLAAWTDRPVPGDSPVVGDRLFVCESGLHVDGLTKDPRTYQPYPPELVGDSQRIGLGRQAGRNAVAACLGRRGMELDGERLASVTTRVRAEARRQRRALSGSEVLGLAVEVCREAAPGRVG